MSENKTHAHLRIKQEDHAEFVRMAKKQGMTIQGKFHNIVQQMKAKEILAELS